LCHPPKRDASFSDKHSVQSPAQQLGVDAPNALLCHACYNSGDDLQLAHPFSAHNDFGPIPKPPPLVHSFAHELDCLLKQLTLAEGAAICRITPMVSIVQMQWVTLPPRATRRVSARVFSGLHLCYPIFHMNMISSLWWNGRMSPVIVLAP
jgi:hypothetical protein